MESILVLGPMIISSILNQQASLAVNNNGVLSDKNKNWSGDRYHQFEQEIYDAMGLKWNGSNWVTSDEYNSANIVQENRFKILHNKNADEKVRKYVARSFVKYVLTLC